MFGMLPFPRGAVPAVTRHAYETTRNPHNGAMVVIVPGKNLRLEVPFADQHDRTVTELVAHIDGLIDEALAKRERGNLFHPRRHEAWKFWRRNG